MTFVLLIYLEIPLQYMYPFNRGIYKTASMTIQGFGGDIAPYDILYYTINSNCEFTTSDPKSEQFTR